jgi:hypothetical protein
VSEGEIVIIGGQRFKQEGGTFINLDVSKDEVTSTANACPQMVVVINIPRTGDASGRAHET